MFIWPLRTRTVSLPVGTVGNFLLTGISILTVPDGPSYTPDNLPSELNCLSPLIYPIDWISFWAVKGLREIARFPGIQSACLFQETQRLAGMDVASAVLGTAPAAWWAWVRGRFAEMG